MGAIAILGCTEQSNQKKVNVPKPERVSAQVPYKIEPGNVSQVVIAGGPHQTAHLPFDWSIYSDPSRPEFWADGDDGILPRPFLHLAGEPTIENAKKVIEWQKLQWSTIREVIKSLGGAAELEGYSDLLGVNVLDEVAKEDPLTAFTKASPLLASYEDEKDDSGFDWGDVGIIYVYSSSCSACKKQHPVIENIRSFGARVVPLQLGEGKPMYKDSLPYTEGEWQSFFPLGDEVATPTMFVVYRGKSPRKHIGFISLSELKKEITLIIGDKNED